MPAMHADSEESASLKMGTGEKGMFSSSVPHLHVMLVHKANVEEGGGAGATTSDAAVGKTSPMKKPGQYHRKGKMIHGKLEA